MSDALFIYMHSRQLDRFFSVLVKDHVKYQYDRGNLGRAKKSAKYK